MGRAAIAEDLFTLSDDPVLLGGRCRSCAALTFPARAGCPRCGADDVDRIELGDRGTLYSWTSQGFPPKAPFRGEWAFADGQFRPWLVGLVELPGLRVESLLVGLTPDDVRIGMELRVVLVPFRTDEESGDEILTFAFTPDTSGTPDTAAGATAPDEEPARA